MSRVGEWIGRNRPVMMRNRDRVVMNAKASAYEAAYRQAPWWFTPLHFFRELDPQMIALLQRMQQSDVLMGSWDNTSEPSEQDRLQAVNWSRWWFRFDPLVFDVITQWTNYGFGQTVTIKADDEELQTFIDEFMESDRNRRVLGPRSIAKLSNILLTDGELFLVFWIKKIDGETTLRYFRTDEITEIVTMPDDKDTPLYYHRVTRVNGQQVDKYYPDWLASPDDLKKAKLPDDAIKAEEEREGFEVKVIHIATNTTEQRGWPLFSASQAWAKAYKEFLTDRAAVAKAIASEVDEVEVEGGSRVVEQFKQQLQSSLAISNTGFETNPPSTAGGTNVHNKAVTRRRLPQTTGAGDAQADSFMFLGQIAAGVLMPPFMLGRTDMMQNKSVAETSMGPTLRAFVRYQEVWRSTFQDICKIITDARIAYAKATFTDTDVLVNLNSARDVSFVDMVDALDILWQRGIVEQKVLTTLALQLPEFALTQDVIETTLKTMYSEEEDVPEEAKAAIMQTLARLQLSLEAGITPEAIDTIRASLEEDRDDSGGDLRDVSGRQRPRWRSQRTEESV